MTIPARVEIVEVGPRDGLQNESLLLPVADKAELIELLARAGLIRIEAGSFVSPAAVPQMASTDELFLAIGSAARAPLVRARTQSARVDGGALRGRARDRRVRCRLGNILAQEH